MQSSSHGSPSSPSLTHASSTNDELDELFDFNKLSPPSGLQDGYLASEPLFDTPEMSALWQQYFPPQKPSVDPLLTTDLAYPFAEAGVPSLLPEDSFSLQPQATQDDLFAIPEETATPSDEAQDDEDMESLYSPDEPVEKPTTRASTSKKASTSTATKKAASAKTRARKGKSVADVAILPSSGKKPAKIENADSTQKDAAGHLPHIVFPVPDYIDRPSAEEYAKMSSKEKRQLRNKISARNFRHRRKEYITTLEEEISTRDTTISTLTEEVTTLKTENKGLRTDLDLLKKTVEDLLNKNRPTDASLNIIPPKSPLLKPNMQKDRSPFASTSNNPWAAGGFSALPSLNVHTTFVPTPSFDSFNPFNGRNINPKMQSRPDPSKSIFYLPGQQEDESFLGGNPYTLGNGALDRYKSQLYGKIAHNVNGSAQAEKDVTQSFKPSFFAPLATSTSKDAEVVAAATSQTAYVASLASSTLLSGVMKSFWKTFAGANPADQVELLKGNKELKIASTSEEAKVGDLTKELASLTVQPPRRARSLDEGCFYHLFQGRVVSPLAGKAKQ